MDDFSGFNLQCKPTPQIFQSNGVYIKVLADEQGKIITDEEGKGIETN